jgi:hypothetical protein
MASGCFFSKIPGGTPRETIPAVFMILSPHAVHWHAAGFPAG